MILRGKFELAARIAATRGEKEKADGCCGARAERRWRADPRVRRGCGWRAVRVGVQGASFDRVIDRWRGRRSSAMPLKLCMQ